MQTKPISNICRYIISCPKDEIHQKLNRTSEITLSVKGRKSGKDIPRLYGLHMRNTLYLLPERF